METNVEEEKMINVTPTQFKKAFEKSFIDKEQDIVSKWKGPLTPFTAVMRSLLDSIAANLGLHIYNSDYYTIDAICYEDKDTEHFSDEAVYAKYIAIAIEHENYVIGSVAEINKLQLFNAPLKVLITYTGEDTFDYYLDGYAKIIKDADIFNDISTTRRQLVIFGTGDGNTANWHFFCYENGKFVQL